MDRFALKYLKIWLEKQSKKPLIIRGARQVGKSTLVRLFAKENDLVLHEVNLERNRQLQEVFTSLNPLFILQELELIIQKGAINNKTSLLFLDEIQTIPEAIQSLRYFYEEMPELPIIAAGSLMEFTLAEKKFSMPVGRVEYFWLGPMSFNEFLSESGDKEFLEYKMGYQNLSGDFSLSCHNFCLRRLKEFNLIGGMPESISEYLTNNSLLQENTPLHSIINTYRDDFGKYAHKEQFLLVQKVFDYLAHGIGKKIKYANISRDHKAQYVSNALDLLKSAQVTFKVCHTSGNGVPLTAESNEKHFKTYLLDIGMFHNLCGIRNISIDREYINRGAAAEQFIAQHLAYLNGPVYRPELFYWLREGKTGNSEVDFLYAYEDKVIPVEVKSGTSGSLKSLQQFCYEKECGLAVRFDLNRPSIQKVNCEIITKTGKKDVVFTLISLPLYMVEEMPGILKRYFCFITSYK